MLASVQDRRIHFKETGPAINRSTLRRVEWDRRCLAAFGTVNGHLDPLTDARGLGRGYRRKPFVLGLLTFLAAFRWILKVFVSEKSLLSRSPDKSFAAVAANYRAIRKFAFFWWGC